MKSVLPGDTVFLIVELGSKRTYKAEVVYSVSNKRGDVRLHCRKDWVFNNQGKLRNQPTWENPVRIEPITPALMTEIRESANLSEE